MTSSHNFHQHSQSRAVTPFSSLDIVMQSLRRAFSKRGRSKSTDCSINAGSPTSASKLQSTLKIAGELPISLELLRSRILPTTPSNHGEFIPLLPPSRTFLHISRKA